MNKFFRRILVLVLPILIIFLGMEFYFRTEINTFSEKAKHLSENLSEIEVLILGSSHMQQAINPKEATYSTANLAYGSQDYYLDSALLFEYMQRIEKLKLVVFEIDYHSLDYKVAPNYWRFNLYNYYYNLDISGIDFLDNLFLITSNKKYYFKNLKLLFSTMKKDINRFGYMESYDDSQFYRWAFDSLKIDKTADVRLGKRHRNQSIEIFNENASKLDSMIEICKENDIYVVLVSTPLYHTYTDRFLKAKLERRDSLLSDLLNKYNDIYWFNYTLNDEFKSVNYYRNDDHLNPVGAKKFTQRLFSDMDEILKSNN